MKRFKGYAAALAVLGLILLGASWARAQDDPPDLNVGEVKLLIAHPFNAQGRTPEPAAGSTYRWLSKAPEIVQFIKVDGTLSASAEGESVKITGMSAGNGLILVDFAQQQDGTVRKGGKWVAVGGKLNSYLGVGITLDPADYVEGQ